MPETYSITTGDTITVHIGDTTISDVPSLELAEQFIELAKHRWPNGDGVLNTNSNNVSLIGSLLIQDLISQIS